MQASETRPLPYGGDVAVAKTIAAAHRPRGRRRKRCLICRAPYPCDEATDARRVIDARQ